MAIVTVFKLPTMTTQKYDLVIAGLEKAGVGNPRGRLHHVASVQTDQTIIVTDVWESAGLLEDFGKVLIPTLHAAGVTPVQPEVTPVHGIIAG